MCSSFFYPLTLVVLTSVVLYLVIDNQAMNKNYKQMPLSEDSNGVVRVNPAKKRVVFGESTPDNIDEYPLSSIVLNAPAYFAPNRVVKVDHDKNVIFYAINANGDLIPRITLTDGGAMSIGQIPLKRSFWNNTGAVIITGSPDDTIADGWHRNSKTDITNSDGVVVGSMHSVQHTEDPTWSGVQIATDDITFTVSKNKVIIIISSFFYYFVNI